MDHQMFHIYEKKSNKVIKHSMTIDEMEQMIAEKKVDWEHWEVQPCYQEYSEASY